jgi:hypothetical protein
MTFIDACEIINHRLDHLHHCKKLFKAAIELARYIVVNHFKL